MHLKSQKHIGTAQKEVQSRVEDIFFFFFFCQQMLLYVCVFVCALYDIETDFMIHIY